MLKAQSGIPARAPRQTLNGPQPGTKQRRGVNSDGPAILPHFHDARMAGHGPGNFEAIAHHTKQLGCGRTLDKFAQITTRLTAMVDRFTSMLDCVDVGFLPDGILDQLPAPSKLGETRVGGIDLDRPRMRAALAGASPWPPLRRVHRRRAHRQVRADDRSNPRATAPARPPTTCANCAANSSSPNPAAPAATRCPRRRPHHHRPAYPPRQGHRPPHRRSPKTTAEVAHPRAGPRSTATTRPSARDMQTLFNDLGSPPRQPHDDNLSITRRNPLGRRIAREDARREREGCPFI